MSTSARGAKYAANPSEDIGVLVRKEKETVGPFTRRAKSKKAVVCKVTKNGAGFKMNSKGKADFIVGARPSSSATAAHAVAVTPASGLK